MEIWGKTRREMRELRNTPFCVRVGSLFDAEHRLLAMSTEFLGRLKNVQTFAALPLSFVRHRIDDGTTSQKFLGVDSQIVKSELSTDQMDAGFLRVTASCYGNPVEQNSGLPYSEFLESAPAIEADKKEAFDRLLFS